MACLCSHIDECLLLADMQQARWQAEGWHWRNAISTEGAVCAFLWSIDVGTMAADRQIAMRMQLADAIASVHKKQ